MSSRHGDLERDLLLAQPVAQPLDRGRHQRRDVGLADVERHDAGIDRGEVEDVVDQGAAARRDEAIDVVHVFALLPVELAERLVRQKLGLSR